MKISRGFCLFVLASLSPTLFAQEEGNKDPVLTILLPMDVREASSQMAIYDRNNDKVIDSTEQKRLGWESEDLKRFDLNRDGKLSHVEVALHYAQERIEAGIVEIDSKIADKNLARYDANKNGQLDPQEIQMQNWPPDVEEYDKNSDGIVTRSELLVELAFRRGLRKELGIMGVDAGGAGKMMNRFDKDRDGKLAPDEYTKAGLTKKALDFDRDGDGLLAVMEIAEMLSKNRRDSGLTPNDQYEARRAFTMWDRDQDGQISKEEMPKQKDGTSFLESMDTNKDGSVSLAEAEASYGSARKSKGFSDSHAASAKRVIARLDKNRSGKIEEDELESEAAQGGLAITDLAAIDKNDDKVIDQFELAKYLAAQAEK